DPSVLGDPGLDVVEAVVALRDEEEQPEGQDLARAERPFPVGRGREVAVQGGDQIKALQGGPQDGQVGHGFDAHQVGFGGIHPSVLPTSPFLENHPEHERTAGVYGGLRTLPRFAATPARPPYRFAGSEVDLLSLIVEVGTAV